MKALILHDIGDICCESIARPKPKRDEVLVRVSACGVCGSDLPRMFTKGAHRMPLICGHEFAGVVKVCGSEVSRFMPDDAVVAFPLLWCGRCPACESGHYAQCRDYDYLGSRSNGGFAEYVCVPERNLLRLPAEVTPEEAAMTEPAAVALHAIKQAQMNPAGLAVAIWGAGPVGLMLAMWARVMGAGPVIIFDLIEEKLALARRLGFEHAYQTRDHDPISTVHALTAGQGADLCLEAAGVGATLLQTFAATKRGGAIVVVGNPSGDVTVPADLISRLMRQEIRIVGTWNSQYSWTGQTDDWRTTLQALAMGRLSLMPLVTHRFGLDEALEPLRKMHEKEMAFCKVLIIPGEH